MLALINVGHFKQTTTVSNFNIHGILEPESEGILYKQIKKKEENNEVKGCRDKKHEPDKYQHTIYNILVGVTEPTVVLVKLNANMNSKIKVFY